MADSLSEVFATNVRLRMAQLGLKTSDLYRRSGISKTTIMALCSGKSKGVQFSTIARLAKALYCQPEHFFSASTHWVAFKWANDYRKEDEHD